MGVKFIMRYILSHPRLTISAKPLANELSKLLHEDIRMTAGGKKKLIETGECIVRYGNSMPIPNDAGFNLNSPEMIRLSGSKLALSNLLSEKDDEEEKLPSLVLYRRVPEDNEFPIVVRTELNRGGGIGIVFCENREQFQQFRGNYWSHYYHFEFELGVHILGGEIKRVFKKVRDENLEPEKFPRRNTNNGYSFSLKPKWEQIYTGLPKFVEKLYSIIPIQMARLDVGYDKKTGGYRLIEINSAPDLSQNKNTLQLYAEFIANTIANR